MNRFSNIVMYYAHQRFNVVLFWRHSLMYEVFIFRAEFVLKLKLLQDKVSLMKYQQETKVSKLWARPSEYPEKWALKKISQSLWHWKHWSWKYFKRKGKNKKRLHIFQKNLLKRRARKIINWIICSIGIVNFAVHVYPRRMLWK